MVCSVYQLGGHSSWTWNSITWLFGQTYHSTKTISYWMISVKILTLWLFFFYVLLLTNMSLHSPPPIHTLPSDDWHRYPLSLSYAYIQSGISLAGKNYLIKVFTALLFLIAFCFNSSTIRAVLLLLILNSWEIPNYYPLPCAARGIKVLLSKTPSRCLKVVERYKLPLIK